MSKGVLARFTALYGELRGLLRRRLGSQDLADEALNDVYIKLSQKGEGAEVQNWKAYFARMAVNAAIDRRRAGAKLASALDIEALLAEADASPGPDRAAEAASDLARLQEAMAELSERQRAVLVAVRIEGQTCAEYAEKLGVSRRTVEIELRRALDHCAGRMENGFAQRDAKTSYH